MVRRQKMLSQKEIEVLDEKSMEEYKKVIARIKSLRVKSGISQEYMAEILQISRHQYLKLENLQARMTGTILIKSLLFFDLYYFGQIL